MTDTIPHYSLYLPKGQRVQLLIPRRETTPFTEWAVVFSLLDDLLELRLSRDRLPTSVSLELGITVELRIIREGTVYSCRVLVVDEPEREFLTVRLVGDMLNCDLREYFRIDAYLPVRYAVPASSDEDLLQRQWAARRDSAARSDNQSATFLTGALAAGNNGAEAQPWAQAHPVAANISGGGIKVNLPEPLPKDAYLIIELFLPGAPAHVIETVGKVVASEKLMMPDDAPPLYQTSATFLYIEERDRDALINYITGEQIRRLRAMQRTEPATAAPPPQPRTLNALVRHGIAVLFVLLVAFILTRYFYNYSQGHEKNEIASIFEGGIKQYIEKLRLGTAP